MYFSHSIWNSRVNLVYSPFMSFKQIPWTTWMVLFANISIYGTYCFHSNSLSSTVDVLKHKLLCHSIKTCSVPSSMAKALKRAYQNNFYSKKISLSLSPISYALLSVLPYFLINMPHLPTLYPACVFSLLNGYVATVYIQFLA